MHTDVVNSAHCIANNVKVNKRCTECLGFDKSNLMMQFLILLVYGLYFVFKSTKSTFAETEYDQIWRKVAGDNGSVKFDLARRMLQLLCVTDEMTNGELQRRYQTHVHREDFLSPEKPKKRPEDEHVWRKFAKQVVEDEQDTEEDRFAAWDRVKQGGMPTS